MVSRYETNVGQAPFDLVVRWLSACGTDLVTAIREFANTVDLGGGLDPGRPYELLDRDLILIERHIKTVPPKSLMAMTPGAPNPKKLEELLRRWRKNPTLLLSGKIESGKFRLAKFLLGIDLVPSRNAKTTTLPMFIRHLDEQPQWQPERVWILDSTLTLADGMTKTTALDASLSVDVSKRSEITGAVLGTIVFPWRGRPARP